MSRYEKLDRLVMNKIGGHPTPFHQIFVRDVEEESKRIAAEDGNVYPSGLIHRRLESLLKKGVIRNVTGKGWVRA
jgi:hypothetical protein|nr:MAG TPA: Iron dependent repressor, N-terminal DNA binding domain [Caudoviricetes sp.]